MSVELTEGQRITSMAEAEATAYEYAVLVEALRVTERRRLLLRERLLDFMQRRDIASIIEGEHGVTVERALRSGPTWYDTRSMPNALVLRLRDLGALGIEAKALRAAVENGFDVNEARSFAHPGGEVTALLVRRRDVEVWEDPSGDES